MTTATANGLEIVAEYPAYILHKPEDREYVAEEVFAVPFQSRRHGTMYSFYTLGSVRAYAERYKEDAAAAVQQATERGHELFYAFQNSTILTAEARPQEIRPVFNIGDTIRFEGRTFRIDRTPNNNVRLTEVEA